MLAHARGMLADAIQVGGSADLQPLERVSAQQNLRNLINSVNFDVLEYTSAV